MTSLNTYNLFGLGWVTYNVNLCHYYNLSINTMNIYKSQFI